MRKLLIHNFNNQISKSTMQPDKYESIFNNIHIK